MRDYQRFFDGLAPRLETARMLERELDTQLARRFNALDYLRTDELGLSRIVADLLNPEGHHGQGATFLKLLLDGLQYSDASEHLGANVKVEVEKTIEDDRRLDIYVQFGDHCLAIENKPYAGDQQNQIKDYLGWLKAKRFKRSVLIYLSPQGEPPSPESVELTHLEAELDEVHSFTIMPYYEVVHGDAWEDGFDDYRLNYTLAEWLADCRKNCDVDRLRWFLRETETFCRRTFGGNTVAKSESNTLKDLVLTDQKNWDVALTVSIALPEVMETVYWRFMEMVWNTWPEEYEYPDDTRYFWGYASQRKKSYIGMYRTSWKSYKGWKNRAYIQCTQLRLEAMSGINNWYIGVCSTNEQFTDKEQRGYRELDAALREAVGESESDGWPWWQFVDERYRNWDTLIPALHRECNGDGIEIKKYFVEKFADIAKAAIPIIDRYE